MPYLLLDRFVSLALRYETQKSGIGDALLNYPAMSFKSDKLALEQMS